MEQASGHQQSAAAMLRVPKRPSGCMCNACQHAQDWVLQGRWSQHALHSGARSSQKAAGRIPKAHQGCPASAILVCGLSLFVVCRLVPGQSDLPASPWVD